MEDGLSAREQRGLVIAATLNVRWIGAAYLVPSQSRNGHYYVDGERTKCSCPDYELRQKPCKHIYAVEYVVQREERTNDAGETEVTETQSVRVTYAQNWPAYNNAQVAEKSEFCRLLHDLCAGVPEPTQTRGRPRLPLSDMLFATTYKVYSTVSGRRFMTDLRAAQAAGHLRSKPHYNSLFNYLDNPTLTPIIRDLITTSSLPLSAVETNFAVDSTGFGTSRFFRYYNAAYKHEQYGHDWLKIHAMIGVKTNVITSVEVTDRNGGDAPQFAPLVTATAQHFNLGNVCADRAYSSNANLALVTELGGTPFVPFKNRARGDGRNPLWNKLFHYFSLHREDFLQHYHQRSNVEATFSSIKRVFGESLRSRGRVAQINEALLKVLCHNIRMLVHEMHELGITPDFRRPNHEALTVA